MKIDKPVGRIKNQPQTITPVNSDKTIMDDAVVTMDSSTALMGGQVRVEVVTRQSIAKTVPKVNIKISR